MIIAPALILAGPSGVGKNTVVDHILRLPENNFSYIRSLTTRMPRDTFSSEYIYVSKEEFLSRIEAGTILEYTVYGGEMYGTPLSEIERAQNEGKIPIMILDINGVENIRKSNFGFPIYAVYLFADPVAILERLKNRDLREKSSESRDKVIRRLQNNLEDYRSLADGRYLLFDAFVENRTVFQASNDILNVFSTQNKIEKEELLSMHAFFDHMAKISIQL